MKIVPNLLFLPYPPRGPFAARVTSSIVNGINGYVLADGNGNQLELIDMTSSYAFSGSTAISSSYSSVSSFSNSASFASSASFAGVAISSSYSLSSSYASSSSFSSVTISASYANSASVAISSSFASSASSASFARLSETSSYLSGSVIATGSLTVEGLVSINNLLWSSDSRKLRACLPATFTTLGGGGPVSATYDGPSSWIGTLGTAVNSRVQAILLQNLTGTPVFSGRGIDFSKKLRFAPTFAQNIIASGVVLRFVACGDNTIRNGNSNALVERGIGVELRGTGVSGSVNLFAHDGTTYVTSSAVNYSSSAVQNMYGFILESTGTGTVNLYWGEGTGSMPSISLTPTLTMTGGPTNAQTISASFLHAYIANPTAGTSTALVQNAKTLLYHSFWQTV